MSPQVKPVYFVIGYFGSGKSEFCVNLAINKKVNCLCDLDVINPYFRSRQAIDFLSQHNIKTVSSIEKDAKYLDMPLISEDIFKNYEDLNASMVIDLGGYDQGAKVIKQFEQCPNREHELLAVINVYRPQSNNANDIIKVINKMETASGLKVTGLVNNTNLLNGTAEDDIVYGENIIKEVSKIINIPIKFTCINKYTKTTRTFEGENIILQMYLENKTS
ncbi:MAG: hypothetical protein LBM72_00195 [Mycoplasmataceae bacterium]|jgi:hypothetical protein|nr:hypothetical protein [Mycoplasmataceae bacterium]